MDRSEAVRLLIDLAHSAGSDEIRAMGRGLEECLHCGARCPGVARCPRFQAAVNAAGSAAQALWQNCLIEALALFLIDCGRYPTAYEGLKALISDSGIPGWNGPYWKPETASLLNDFEYVILSPDEPCVLTKCRTEGGRFLS